MDIINATKEHLESVYELICELESTKLDKCKFSQVYSDNLQNSNIFYILAVNNAKIIGFASLHIHPLLHHCGNIGEIQELVISKDEQGTGVGSLLFDQIKKLAAGNHCLQLEVCCNKIRERSHKFYLKQGMQNSHFKFIYYFE